MRDLTDIQAEALPLAEQVRRIRGRVDALAAASWVLARSIHRGASGN